MAAIKMVTQLSSQPRTSQPSAYSRQYSQHQRQRQLPQLPSKSFSYPVSSYEHQHNSASGQITSTYMPVRNRLAEQESRPMNQTYTIGMANRIPMRNRSSSIDSDFADYTIHGAISGLFPRSESTKFGNRISRKGHSQSNAPPASSLPSQQQQINGGSCLWLNKLPSLDSHSALCSQRSYGSSRTQNELAKYKNNLKHK